MRPLVCIDPGAHGSFAVLDPDGIVRVQNMPEGMSAQVDLLRSLAVAFPTALVVVEKVGFHRPGNSATASTKFGRHVGHIEAGTYAVGLPSIQVSPITWQKALGQLPTDKGKRKSIVREIMARRFPGLVVTKKNADGLGILFWAMSNQANGAAIS